MADLLAILNPRRLPREEATFRKLPIDRLWISRMTEGDVTRAWPEVLEHANGYDRMLVCADDVEVPQAALDAVTYLLDAGHPVVTGYCNLDQGAHVHEVNICKRVLGPLPTVDAYSFYTLAEVRASRMRAVHTSFVGMCLTGMSVDLWREVPFQAMGMNDRGYASDFMQSIRLDQAGVPMVAARDGFCWHTKETWNKLDRGKGRELLIGKEPPSIVLERIA